MAPTTATIEARVGRLTTASARRVIEPDDEVTGHLGDGQVVPDELLTVAGLGLDLTAEQRRVLSREELAAITQAGIRFEAVLEAGFAAQLATAADLTDPRLTFVLHEMGEETRHQRLFQRLLAELDAKATSPVPFRLVQLAYRSVIHASVRYPALFYALVLTGEEIPDLIQRLAADHPGTDPFVKAVARYHRGEEARHLSFARAVYPEVWAAAGPVDRALVRHVAPGIARMMFDVMVHPGVYETVGLPGMRTWRQVNRSPVRTDLRRQAMRPVLDVLVECGAFRRGVPAGWRRLCGVGRRAPATRSPSR